MCYFAPFVAFNWWSQLQVMGCEHRFFPHPPFIEYTDDKLSSGCNGSVSGISRSSTTCTGNCDWKLDGAPGAARRAREHWLRVDSGHETAEWKTQRGHGASGEGHMTLFLVNKGLQPCSDGLSLLAIPRCKLLQCWTGRPTAFDERYLWIRHRARCAEATRWGQDLWLQQGLQAKKEKHR